MTPAPRTTARLEAGGETFEVALEPRHGGFRATVDGEAFEVRLDPNGAGHHVHVGDRRFHAVSIRDGEARLDGTRIAYRVVAAGRGAGAGGRAGGAAHVRPPMPGRLERLLVNAGDAVEAGQVLFVLEAMKMHNEVRSPVAGRVKAVHAVAGAALDPARVVLDLEPLS